MTKLYTVNQRNSLSTGFALLILICSFMLASAPQTANAQINEYFESPNTAGTVIPNLPFGWTQKKVSGVTPNANDFVTMSGSGTNPAATAQTGSQMLQYRGYSAPAGEEAFLASPAYDFRGGSGTFAFQFYHSTTGASGDFIEVYTNSTPLLSGATLIAGSSTNRNNGTTGWALKSFTIPQQAGNCRTYIIIRAVSGATNSGNMYFDSFQITNNSQAMTYTSAFVVQNANPIGQGAANEDILGMRIITCGQGTPLSVTEFNFNTNGTTNLANITNAKVYYTKGEKVFNPANVASYLQFGATIPAPIGTNIGFTGSQTLENDTNYFWLTYTISGTATTGQYVDADWLDFKIGATPYSMNQAPSGARLIAMNYCIPQYGCGTCWPGDFIHDVQTFNGIAGNIVNNCTGANPSPPYYTFYPPAPNRTTTLQQGQQYSLRTRVGTYPSGNNTVAWIDFDGNGYFSENERIYEAYFANGNAYLSGGSGCNTGQATDVFYVPVLGGGTNASFWGPRRMRVREMWITNSGAAPILKTNAAFTWTTPFPTTTTPAGRIHPCNYYTYGETEDYVVTIVPNCFSGEWLGFTEDWDDPQNWCDGVPTPTTNVTIPTVPKGGKFPHLFDGTLATCNNILIQAGATVTVESPKNGNWQIYGTLTNNGTITVLTSFTNNFTIGTGALTSVAGAYTTPFIGQMNDQRTQMRYMASELLANGFTSGDAISTIGIQTASIAPGGVNGGPNPFGPPAGQEFVNFTVTMGHTASPSSWVFAPPQNTAQSWYTFSGGTASYTVANLNPPANSTLTFPLSGTFIWNGTDDILVEMCYNNNNATGNRTDGMNVYFTQTTGVPSFKTTGYQGASALTGCTLGSPANGSAGYFGNVLDRRPNLVVESFSPNSIYPIYVRGDWVNNGTFTAGRSNVIFDGTVLQNISGTNLTTFSRLSVAKTGVVRLNRVTDVDSSLYLNSGVLELGGYTLTLKNPTINPAGTIGTLSAFHSLTSVPAWARNTGFVRAETMLPATLGYIQWNIGNVSTAPSLYTFPFGSGAIGSNTGTLIALDVNYEVANTNLGNVKATTYATPPNNLAMPPTVTHINGFATPNDPYMIDRYWIIERTGTATTGAGFNVRWITTENAAMNPVPYAVQRWDGANWPAPGIGTHSGTSVTVSNAQFNAYAQPGWQAVNIWAAAGFSTPLPIELLSFDAQLRDRQVLLNWTTASEKDNNYFTIEKTRDASEFLFVKQVPGAGTSNSIRNYSAIDPDPFRGLSYYRLGQTDYDGTTTYSKLVPINYDYSQFDIVYTINEESSILVAFGYDSEEPVSYYVTDALGRILIKEEKVQTVNGSNFLRIDASSLGSGVYFINIYNSEKNVSKKLFYSKQ